MASVPNNEKMADGKDVAVNQTSAYTPQLASSPSDDLDDSYNLYKAGVREGEELDPQEANSVLRKIDWRIIPMLWLIYLLQYLDKNGINYASVYGLRGPEGVNLHGNEYSWLSSIYYFGYLISQWPAGYAMQRLPLGKVLGSTTVTWGVILILTPACTSFSGIAANRFFLGCAEAVVNPGFVLVMSMWYKSQEQPLRLEAYYCTNGIATMFGGLIGYAIGHIESALPRWMYVFFLFGAISIVAGLVALVVLPDLPSTAKFLNERERVVAVERVSGNRQGVKNQHFKKNQAYQVLIDPKTWILFTMATAAQIPNSALTSFASIIVGSFGFETLQTQYMQIPGGAIQFLALIGGGFICSRFPNARCVTMIVANSICILGSALLVGLPENNQWGRMVALWLCYFQSLGFSMSLTMISSNIAGYTKKQLTGAVLFTGYCIGNIISPQMFKDSKPTTSAYIAMLVGYVVKLLMVVVLYIYMWGVNKKRDREAALSGNVSEEEEKAAIERGMHDMTELDNKGFRYSL